MTRDWDAWLDSRPAGLDKRSQYTATLLHTLERVGTSAPFQWALTGGTALQSHFEECKRRYSSDIEIITPASYETIDQWIRDQGWKPSPVLSSITKAPLSPDGTLFVIHDYDPAHFSAAGPTTRIFRHFPIPEHPPPGVLSIPLLSYDFLIATKIFGIGEPTRGGERFKDIHDLALGLPGATIEDTKPMLALYQRIRGAKEEPEECIRKAGAWIRHFLDDRSLEFERWRGRFVVNTAPFDARDELASALGALERLYGAETVATPVEKRRFLLASLTPKRLGPVAEALGYPGSTSKEVEKMADFIASKVLPRLTGPAPRTPEDLLEELQRAIGL